MTIKEFKPAFFSIQDRDSIVVATVTETSLTEEDNIEQFGVELNQTIESYGTYWLALDLQHVKYMSSSAIGKLIGLHRNLHRHQGRLVISGVTGTIQNILQTAKLIDYFHIVPGSDDAVERLSRDATTQLPGPNAKPR